jgi:acyl-coenzyme A synthetase/AMP-(fatty) acid ligase
MQTPRPKTPRLAERVAQSSASGRWLWDGLEEAQLGAALTETRLDAPLETLLGRSVLLRTHGQLAAALALLELDGVARRIVLCPPDLDEADLPAVMTDADIDAVVGTAPCGSAPTATQVSLGPPRHGAGRPNEALNTEWVMFTSGTTGRPKMVAHTLEGLTGAISAPTSGPWPIWGTFYDIRRYGGLQMLLRALIAGGSMILSRQGESASAFLGRLGERGVTHLAATPSHWRQALMSPALDAVAPIYLRLSGEIADQAVLDALKARFPGTPIGHAYASTEAGVGFEVTDGLEGFPVALTEREDGPVRLRVVDGSLQLCSSRAATRYVRKDGGGPAGPDGFVDTGDMVERRGARYHFVGRRDGVINVGGLKVHPEEVEAVINRQPGVRMSRVLARKSPITGAVVSADILAEPGADRRALEAAVLEACRRDLSAHKAPAVVRFVEDLAVTNGGKLERR